MNTSTKAIGLSILSAFLLSACDDIAHGPYKNTVEGAGVGAATGAVAGAVLGDDKQDIINGAVLGGLVGGVVGSTQD